MRGISEIAPAEFQVVSGGGLAMVLDCREKPPSIEGGLKTVADTLFAWLQSAPARDALRVHSFSQATGFVAERRKLRTS